MIWLVFWASYSLYLEPISFPIDDYAWQLLPRILLGEKVAVSVSGVRFAINLRALALEVRPFPHPQDSWSWRTVLSSNCKGRARWAGIVTRNQGFRQKPASQECQVKKVACWTADTTTAPHAGLKVYEAARADSYAFAADLPQNGGIRVFLAGVQICIVVDMSNW